MPRINYVSTNGPGGAVQKGIGQAGAEASDYGYIEIGSDGLNAPGSFPFRVDQSGNVTGLASLLARLTALPKSGDGPSMTAGAAGGTGATVSANGNDCIGQINWNTGTGSTTGNMFHLTFDTPYANQPFVFICSIDQAPFKDWWATSDQNGFDLWAHTTPAASTNFPYAYVVVERPWLLSPP